MSIHQKTAPDNTAARTALWRALHVEADESPHVFEDVIGLSLLAPDAGWQNRPDMSAFTRPFRASIVARARFVEDLLIEQAQRGILQYVMLGAGLDTFAQRKPELAAIMQIFEIDQAATQEWKRQRLIELGFGISPFLHLVPVDFEAGDAWTEQLLVSGFDFQKPAVVAAMGVSMYLSQDAISASLRHIAQFASGSILIMSFMLPIAMAEPEFRPGIERAATGAAANGTPWLSFFTPGDMLALARECGFKQVQHISADELTQRYFANRTDGLRLPSNSEELLLATT